MPIDTSAQIGIAKIDESEIGLIFRGIDESLAEVDSFSKHKSGTKTITEGLAEADSITKYKVSIKNFVDSIAELDILSKFKVATPTFLEGLGNLDSFSKFKSAFKTIKVKLGLNDWSQFYANLVHGRGSKDHPKIRIENEDV